MSENSGRLEYDEARLKEYDPNAKVDPVEGVFTPPEEPLLKWFEYHHLPHTKLREASVVFHDTAHTVVAMLPRSAERTVALRKLLEAKDAAVRATVETLKG